MLNNKVAMLLVGVLLASILAACGGSSDKDATATVTAGPAETSVAIAPTETRAPAATATPVATSSPTPRPTAAPRPIATTPPTATIAPTPTEEPVGSVEDNLTSWLLQPDDLDETWETLYFGYYPVADEANTRCGMEPFAQRFERVTGVQATYQTSATFYGHIYNAIDAFPSPEIAQAALEWQVSAANCQDYTDASGMTYTVYPGDRGEWAEDSFEGDMEIVDADGTQFFAHFAYFRHGHVVGTLAFLTNTKEQIANYAWQVGYAAIGTIAASTVPLDGAAGSGIGQSRLITAEDLARVDDVNTWEATAEIDSTASGRFEVCPVGSFPDVLGAESETGVFLSGNNDEGPWMAHSIVVMAPGNTAGAMTWIRESFTACESWVDGTNTYTVAAFNDLEVGDDTAWVLLNVNGEDGSTGQLGYGFTKVGDMISVVAFIGDGVLDLKLFGAMIKLGQMVTAGEL